MNTDENDDFYESEIEKFDWAEYRANGYWQI
jgi:hypothetical protein